MNEQPTQTVSALRSDARVRYGTDPQTSALCVQTVNGQRATKEASRATGARLAWPQMITKPGDRSRWAVRIARNVNTKARRNGTRGPRLVTP